MTPLKLAALILSASALACGPGPGSGLETFTLRVWAAEVAPAYILGPGDKVRIVTYGEPSLSGDFDVGGSGAVDVPLAGQVRAQGLTTTGFGLAVEAALRDGFLKDPKVSVEVVNYRPFYILGEVGRPGQYPYTSGLTVLNAVATAGGFTYRADTHRVRIKRAGDPSEHLTKLTADTPVEPGDTLRIGERYF